MIHMVVTIPMIHSVIIIAMISMAPIAGTSQTFMILTSTTNISMILRKTKWNTMD
jgi:hypothetical protein